MEDHETSKQANHFAGGNGEVAILLYEKQEFKIYLCLRWLGKCQELTFAIETAAQIMFASPNSVEETPAT